MTLTCEECMKGAPYTFCCKRECGEHEFCRGCTYQNSSEMHCFDDPDDSIESED